LNSFVSANTKQWEETSKNAVERWSEVFEHFEREGISMKNLKNLIGYIFVLPAHNASVERMFSKNKDVLERSKIENRHRHS